jgi:hypothetical protein
MKLLVVSSLFFLTNFTHNTIHRKFVYAWLFLLLTITSIFVHSSIFQENPDFHFKIVVLDKVVIFNVFLYGLYLFLNNQKSSIYPILSISTVFFFYVGGYFMENFCFHPDFTIGNIYHSMVHIIGSLGHHFIIYEYGYSREIRIKILEGLMNPTHNKVDYLNRLFYRCLSHSLSKID